jgi:MurNAc alpha-1-phosphate uridylyltransferase
MVLGAGLGTRLRPFTDRLPKPLFPVLGVPCVEFALRTLSEAGVRDVAVNVHAHADQLERWLHAHGTPGLRLAISDERKLLLGSAGGFRRALDLIPGERFISMNADVIHLTSIEDLAATHEKRRLDHGIWMTLVLNRGRALEAAEGAYREILVDEASSLITGFGEKKTGVPFYSGTAVFEKSAFSALKPGVPAEFVPEVLEPAIRQGKVAFVFSEDLWIDIGSPELWLRAQDHLRQAILDQRVPESLRIRLEHADPTVGGRFELGKNTIRMDDIVYEIAGVRGS